MVGVFMNNFGEKVSFIWQVADLLRGPYRPNQYKDVMLPMTVLRRVDCVLEPSKEKVLAANKKWAGRGKGVLDAKLRQASGLSFYNTSRFTFDRLKGDPDNIAANLTNFIKGFSPLARDLIDQFKFEEQIATLDKADRLFLLVQKFSDIDLHPDTVPNIEMGYIFEELIRRFNEASNEEAGDHFTPREVIRLMVDLIFMFDEDVLTTKGIVKTVYDPAAGTGGMLSVAEDYVRDLNPDAQLEVFGQDFNPQSYAICGSDMLIKGKNIDHIAFGDVFTDERFDYMLANPPFGVDWKIQASKIRKEHLDQGSSGRFGAGLPSVDDGAIMFLQHMISKMKDPEEGGTRLAVVFNGSPLFSDGPASDNSKTRTGNVNSIRRWILENDMLEAIVALPDQLFYNTSILTYLWIVTNRKEPARRGKIQLVDGTSFFEKMRKSLNNKRKEIGKKQRDEITRLYGDFVEVEHVRIFDNEDFGYRRITVERPLKLNFAAMKERVDRIVEAKPFQNLATSKKRKNFKAAEKEIAEGKALQDAILAAVRTLEPKGVVKNRDEFVDSLKATFKVADIKVPAPVLKAVLAALRERDQDADTCTDSKGNVEPDPELRDYENVPLKEDIHEYLEREVLPHVPDAWIDEAKTKIGYEFNFNRYFYKYTPPRQLEDIQRDLRAIEDEIADMLNEAASE